MHLLPHEEDKIRLHFMGWIAQKRLARGLKLNLPEATALISSQVLSEMLLSAETHILKILEFIRDGKTVSECMQLGRELLGRRQVSNSFSCWSKKSADFFRTKHSRK